MDSAAEHLSENLKMLRRLRGLTQARLARLSEVPRSTLANIEVGGSNPTLTVLVRVAAALRVSLAELISEPPKRLEHFPRGTLPVVMRGKREKVSVDKLLPHPTPGMEIDRMVLEPGSRLAGVPHMPGTHEYLYCERGSITLWVSGEKLRIAVGDVASFAGDQRHSYANNGRGAAIGFSVVTLRSRP